jgi:dephospho-CoA kinase
MLVVKTLGLTGGLGMGKSTVADLLRHRGLRVVDTDDLARQLVEPGQPALIDIAQTFGPDLIDPQGRLQRAPLAQRVFANDASRRQLEAILHPRIRALWKEQVAHWHRADERAAVVVIPLLFETQAESEFEFDAILCVACSAPTQSLRLQSRGWSAADVALRNRAQWPVDTKMARADFVLWNEAELSVLDEQLSRVLMRVM